MALSSLPYNPIAEALIQGAKPRVIPQSIPGYSNVIAAATGGPIIPAGQQPTQQQRIFPITNNQLPQGSNVVNPTGVPSGGSPAPQGPSQAEIDAINEAYATTLGVFNTAEANYNAAYPKDVANLNAQYDLYGQRLSQSNQSAVNNLDLSESQLNQARESAQNRIRQGYNEIGQSIASRFGNASSAGPAMYEILGRETQSQLGSNETATVNGLIGLKNQRADLMKQFESDQKQLDLQRQAGVDEIKKDFDARILQIQLARGQTEAAKAQARLDLFVEAKQRAQALEDSYQTLKQNLANSIATQDDVISQREAQTLYEMANTRNVTQGQIASLYTGKNLPSPNAYQQAQDSLAGLRGYYNPTQLSDEEKRRLGLI